MNSQAKVSRPLNISKSSAPKETTSSNDVDSFEIPFVTAKSQFTVEIQKVSEISGETDGAEFSAISHIELTKSPEQTAPLAVKEKTILNDVDEFEVLLILLKPQTSVESEKKQ